MTTDPSPHRAAVSRQRGITLVEACIVLAVTSILASTAAPGFQSMMDARRLDGNARQLATDLHFIRTEAVSRSQALRISHHAAPGGSCYVIHSGAGNQCSCPAAGPAVCSGGAVEIKTVAIASADHVSLQPNVSSMLFDPVHGTSSPTGTWKLVGADGRAVHHVVNIMGRVRSCSPQGKTPGYAPC